MIMSLIVGPFCATGENQTNYSDQTVNGGFGNADDRATEEQTSYSAKGD